MTDTNNHLSQKDERTFTGIGNILGILGFIPSLVVFLVYQERSEFLNRNMKSALNFQITMVIADIVGTIFSIVGIGGLIILAAWVLRLVFSILAFVKTNEGEDYVYPMTFTFIK
ncbi:MAG: hypothetical protein RLZZ600_326 [Actinomycetota bacterium]|jgi:uncharacterized Tic20 family protein